MSNRDDDREPILIETDERTDILELAHLESQRTLDTQIETLSDIDDKAARILRVNLVLLSVVLTGISIAADSTPSGTRDVLPSLVNGYTVAGIGCLVVSTALAAVTYTSSDTRVGLGGSDIRSIVTDDFGEREIVEGLVLSYARWIEHNYDTNVRNAALSTVMLLFLIYAVAALALGTKQAVGGRISPIVLGCSSISLVVVTWYTGVHWQLRRCFGDRTSEQRGKTNSSGGRTNSQ